MNIIEQHRAVAYYREAFHDMPVGGPMDGAAYGEYLKSKALGMIVGVVASVATMGAGFAVMGATLASQLAGGAMIAGGAMSGLGAVTGNKKLSKIGGVLSLAGGIGSAAIALTGGATGAIGSSLGEGSSALSQMGDSFRSSFTGLFGEGVPSGGGTAGAAPSGGEFTVPTEAEMALQGAPETGAAIDQSARASELANATIGSDASSQVSAALDINTPPPVQSASTPDVSNTVSGGMSQAPSSSTGAASDLSLKDAMTKKPLSYGMSTANGEVPSNIYGAGAESGGKGLLDTAWQGTKDFFGSKLGQETTVGLLKGAAENYGKADMNEAQTKYLDSKTTAQDLATQIQSEQWANMKHVPIALNPTDPNYAAKKAVAQAAGQATFDIAQVAPGQVTRNPIQNQFTSSPAAAR